MVRGFYVLAVLQFAAVAAWAHPVAQGAMDITVSDDHVYIHARVSLEEALVAEALNHRTNDKSGSMQDVYSRHAEYLLGHLYLASDDVQLVGTIAAITPPNKNTMTSSIGYDLEFAIPTSTKRPRTFVARQNVLNEFVFAPGNRWEASYIVRISQLRHSTRETLLFTSRQPLKFTRDSTASTGEGGLSLSQWATFSAFVRYGIAHILGGYDHLLFIAGLVIALGTFWDLLKIVTAFTVAHTITLTLAVLDVFRLSSRVVEPMIAASIVIVALQNLTTPHHAGGRARLVVAFGFGLFHGLGFAGGLLEAMEEMAGVMVVSAIAAFSIGVEVGHQLVSLPLFALMKMTGSQKLSRSDPERIRLWALRGGSTAIGAAGMVYLIAALR